MISIDIIESKIQDVNMEMLIVGSVYRKPDLLLDYGELIKPKYDFYHETSRFLYNSMFELYSQYANNNIDEVKVNVFMNQNEERKKKYKKIGEYQYIERLMELASEDDFETYYNNLKKYSLLRELEKKGFPAQKIFEKKVFDKLTPEQVMQSMEYSLLTIGTEIGGIEESIILGKDIPDVYEQWKTVPDFGTDIPFRILNSLIRGARMSKLNLIGMHSGCGKSRKTSKIMAYIGIKLGLPIVSLINEQDKNEWDAMILSVVVNNPEFGFIQELQKHNINGIDETKIVTGQCQGIEDEICRKAAQWIAQNSKIHWMMLSKFDYNTIKRQIKRHKIKGCNFFFYDTLKSPDHDWQSFVKTGDMLKDICNELKVCGFATFQLTDDSLFDEILTSKAIASGKHIKHIADGLFMYKALNKGDYDKYQIYDPDDELGVEYANLDKSKDYYVCYVDKNRGGKDKDQILIEVDKGKNLWVECGYLLHSETAREYQRLKKEHKNLKMQKEVEKLRDELHR